MLLTAIKERGGERNRKERRGVFVVSFLFVFGVK